MKFSPLLSQLLHASKREQFACLWFVVVFATVFGCTPSARDVRRSDVFYERCRVLRATDPGNEALCFQDWLRHYARAETGTRIAYAEERVHVADPAAHDVLEMATGEEEVSDVEVSTDQPPVTQITEPPTAHATARATGLRESETSDARTLRYQEGASRRTERLRTAPSSAHGCAYCGPQYEACFPRCASPLQTGCRSACRSQERLCRRGCF